MNKTILSLILIIFFTSFCITAPAMEIAIVYEGKSVPNIMVNIIENKDTRMEQSHTYLTNLNGIINTTISENYYWIEINTKYKERSTYNEMLIFNNEVWLQENEMNIIDCGIETVRTPGFELLVFLISLIITILLIRRRKK